VVESEGVAAVKSRRRASQQWYKEADITANPTDGYPKDANPKEPSNPNDAVPNDANPSEPSNPDDANPNDANPNKASTSRKYSMDDRSVPSTDRNSSEEEILNIVDLFAKVQDKNALSLYRSQVRKTAPQNCTTTVSPTGFVEKFYPLSA
jgi:hypothetical protein